MTNGIQRKRWPLGAVAALLTTAACTCGGLFGGGGGFAEFIEEDPVATVPSGGVDDQAVSVGLEIINTSGVELCYIAVSASTEEYWGPSIIRESLQPGDAFVYQNFGVREYDFLAEDCADNPADTRVIDEVYNIQLGQGFVIWRIGEDVTTANEPTIAEAPATPEALEVEVDPVEQPEALVAAADFDIVNTAGVDVCDIQISPSTDEFFGPNRLPNTLPPGGLFEFEIDVPGYYDIAVYDCADGLLDERYFLFLGQDDITYNIDGTVDIGGGPPESKTFVYEPTFESDDCFFDVPSNMEIDCGYLIVPEDRTLRSTTNIELAVAIIRNETGSTLPDPIIHLSGGPGQSMVDLLADDPEYYLFESYAPNRDQIFIDQRGTGYSLPTLNCPEVEDVSYDSDDIEAYYDAVEDCRARLVNEGVNLAAYNTAENAADIHDLTVALGYDQANLYGVSYGTRLALAVMRDHPENVRSVTLDSVFPPNVNVLIEDSVSQYLALVAVFDACAADPACNSAYPDLENVFLQVVASFNLSPVTMTFGQGFGAYDDEISGDDVVDTFIGALFAAGETLEYMPRAIYGLRDGNFDAYLAIDDYLYGGFSTQRQFFDGEDYSDAEGMFNSVTCRDEYAFEDYSAAEAVVLQELPEELHTALFYNPVAGQFRECSTWGSGKALSIETEAVISNIPTLLIVGSFDPVTPPSQAQLANQTLTSGYYVEFPYQGHSVTGFSFCATDIMAEFINNPLRAPDTSCVATEPVPGFLLPGDPLGF